MMVTYRPLSIYDISLGTDSHVTKTGPLVHAVSRRNNAGDGVVGGLATVLPTTTWPVYLHGSSFFSERLTSLSHDGTDVPGTDKGWKWHASVKARLLGPSFLISHY